MSELKKDESLLFHFPMDEIFAETLKGKEIYKVHDRLNKGQHAEVEAVRVVSDDIFEGCALFGDPKSTFKYQRNEKFSGSEDPYTVTFWAKIGDSGKPDQNLLSLGFKKNDQSQLLNKVHFPHPAYKQNLERQQDWFHCAYVFEEKGKRPSIYTDGYQHINNDEKAFESLAYDQLIINSVTDTGAVHADVRIANLCLHNKALSKEDILKEKQATAGGSASETFQSTHPLEFAVEDQESTSVLYISDDPKPKTLRIKIRSVSSDSLEIVPLKRKSTTLDEGCHFEIIFKPKTLKSFTGSDESQQYLQVSNLPSEDWHFSQVLHPEKGEISARFTYVKSDNAVLHLTSEQELSFEMYYKSAEPSLGSRSSSLMFLYDNIRFARTQGIIRDSLISTINIVNQSGRKNIPIVATIVGSSTISNVYPQKSRVTIRLTNTLKREPEKKEASSKNALYFSSGGMNRDDDTKFTLRFDKSSLGNAFNIVLKTKHEIQYEKALEEIKDEIFNTGATGKTIASEVDSLIKRSFNLVPNKDNKKALLDIIKNQLGKAKNQSSDSVDKKFLLIEKETIDYLVSDATERAIAQAITQTKDESLDEAFKNQIKESIGDSVKNSASPTFQQAANQAISSAIEQAINGKISRSIDGKLKEIFNVPQTAETCLKEKLMNQIKYAFNSLDNSESLEEIIAAIIAKEADAHESKKEVIDGAITRAFEQKPDSSEYKTIQDLIIVELYQSPEDTSIKRTLGEYISDQLLNKLFNPESNATDTKVATDADLVMLIKPLVSQEIGRALDEKGLEDSIKKIIDRAVDQAISERMDITFNKHSVLVNEQSIIDRFKSLIKREVYQVSDERSFYQKVDEVSIREIEGYKTKRRQSLELINQSFNQTPLGGRLSFVMDAMMVKLYESSGAYEKGKHFIVESLVDKILSEFFKPHEKFRKALDNAAISYIHSSVKQNILYLSNDFELDQKVVRATNHAIDAEINLKVVRLIYQAINQKTDQELKVTQYEKQILINRLRHSAKHAFDQPTDMRLLETVVADVIEAESKKPPVN